jgi:hypothetical protein
MSLGDFSIVNSLSKSIASQIDGWMYAFARIRGKDASNPTLFALIQNLPKQWSAFKTTVTGLTLTTP